MERSSSVLPPPPPPKTSLDNDRERLLSLEDSYATSHPDGDWPQNSSHSGFGLAITTNEVFFTHSQPTPPLYSISSDFTENKIKNTCGRNNASSSPFTHFQNTPLPIYSPPPSPSPKNSYSSSIAPRSTSLRVVRRPDSIIYSTPPPVPPKDPKRLYTDLSTSILQSPERKLPPPPLPPLPLSKRISSFKGDSFLEKKESKFRFKTRRMHKRVLSEVSRHFQLGNGSKTIWEKWRKRSCMMM